MTGYIIFYIIKFYNSYKTKMISENIEKWKINYKNIINNNTNNAKFKNNFYSMSDSNTCIAEPKLDVLPLHNSVYAGLA